MPSCSSSSCPRGVIVLLCSPSSATLGLTSRGVVEAGSPPVRGVLGVAAADLLSSSAFHQFLSHAPVSPWWHPRCSNDALKQCLVCALRVLQAPDGPHRHNA
eukprot:5957571-Amphidinium_carterae.6